MRFTLFGGLLLVTACATPEVQQQKLQDGSYKIQCELSMDECLRRTQATCENQRFRILEGTSETRLRDAPPFEKAYHTSRLHLVCNNDGADVLLSIEGNKAPPTAAPTPAAPAKACSAGQTRECVGTAACKGGQACLPDGSGFGSCDCGPAPVAPSAPPSEAVSSPAGAPATASPSPTPAAAGAPAPGAPSR